MALNDVRRQTAERLAGDVLTLSRSTLMLNFRFLDRALSGLDFKCTDDLRFATDGRRLYFEPWYVLGQYKAERTVMNRDMMHCILHCVFRHNFVGKDIDRLRWDLACDMAVESTMNDLKAPCLAAHRCRCQLAILDTVRSEVCELSAERIYKWLGDRQIPEDELTELRLAFFADEHGVWYGSHASCDEKSEDIDLEQMWKEISRRMQTELETMAEDKSSPLVQSLRSLNRAKHDYSEFLRRFGVRSETLRISDEEFDNNFYTYGLSLYGNMPLIEPLEYSEQRRIRDFVIAIDTSGSVKGDVVQSFIQHTHDILQRQENFFTKVNMHIIQCDDRIREDALITCRADFEKYISEMEIKGLGKTDFRPVFAYVDELLRSRKLTDLRGLLYFTDGKGEFPAKKPKYDTAFILHLDGYDAPDTPPWAMRLELTEEDILDKRFGRN